MSVLLRTEQFFFTRTEQNSRYLEEGKNLVLFSQEKKQNLPSAGSKKNETRIFHSEWKNEVDPVLEGKISFLPPRNEVVYSNLNKLIGNSENS